MRGCTLMHLCLFFVLHRFLLIMSQELCLGHWITSGITCCTGSAIEEDGYDLINMTTLVLTQH